MLFKAPYVTFRNGHPYFMIRVPTDLVDKFNKKFIRKALKTQNPSDAKMLSEAWASKAKTAFTLLRADILSEVQQQSLLSTYSSAHKRPSRAKPARLNNLYDLYYAEKSSGWTGRTPGEFNKQFENILKIIGNRPANDYDRSDFVACRDELAARLAPQTVNKYLSLLSSVLRWAVKHEYITRNPAEGLQLDINKRADEERKAYDLTDIKKITLHLPCKDGTEPYKFWIPMIAMYTGMRRGEICQLQINDIKQLDGIWCFDINDNAGKSLKTKSSARIIPIHSQLIKLGFLSFVNNAESTDGNLWVFRQWKGIWGKKFGNWYSRFNRAHITEDPHKVFHSFRHTVANILKQTGVPESVAAGLLGHEQGGITFNRYGKRYLPSRLAEAVEAISYG